MANHKRREDDPWFQQARTRAAKSENRPVTHAGCAKKTYASKQAAKLALKRVQADRRDQAREGTLVKGGEDHAYRCKACRLWHLTSHRWTIHGSTRYE